jgi:hypothetical protein
VLCWACVATAKRTNTKMAASLVVFLKWTSCLRE